MTEVNRNRAYTCDSSAHNDSGQLVKLYIKKQ